MLLLLENLLSMVPCHKSCSIEEEEESFKKQTAEFRAFTMPVDQPIQVWPAVATSSGALKNLLKDKPKSCQTMTMAHWDSEKI